MRFTETRLARGLMLCWVLGWLGLILFLVVGSAFAQAPPSPSAQVGPLPFLLPSSLGQTALIPTGGSVPTPLATLLSRHGLTPDDFYQAADGSDDAPSIQRALNAACSVVRTGTKIVTPLSRHYAINSAISAPCAVHVRGERWQEWVTAGVANLSGTWFDIGPVFAGSATSPINVPGFGASGTTIENIGFSEPGQPAPPVAVMSGANVTGWSPATWTPVVYPPVVYVSDSFDVTLLHTMFMGVFDGVRADRSARFEARDTRGQAFDDLIAVHWSYDVARIDDVQFLPVWSTADPVLAYQQANADVIRTFRSDTPFFDHVFGILARSAIDFEWDPVGVAGAASTPPGTTTGADIGGVSCDFIAHCFRFAPNVAGFQFQASRVRSFGQQWNTVTGAPVTMLPGSDVFHFELGNAGAGTTDAYGIAQIGAAQNFGSAVGMVSMPSPTLGSILQFGSMHQRQQFMPANSNLVVFPTTGSGVGTVSVAFAPILEGPAPSGFAVTNQAPNGAGVGTFSTGATAAAVATAQATANAAVQRAGDTMTGTLAVPDLNINGAGSLVGPWTVLPLTISSPSGAPGAYTAAIKVKTIGRTRIARLVVNITTLAPATGYLSVNGFPFTALEACSFLGRELGSGKMLGVTLNAGTSAGNLSYYDNSTVGATYAGVPAVMSGECESTN